MRLYDSELEENIEHDMENLLSSLSEGKDQPVEKAAHGHVRKDLDTL